MAQPFIAEVRIFTYTFAPAEWAYCDGQVIPIAQNTALFSLVSDIYGGDGRSTFGLPDMQGRAPMQWGTGPGLTPYNWGEYGGSPSAQLDTSELPSHNHQINGQNSAGDNSAPGNRFAAFDSNQNARIRNLKPSPTQTTTMAIQTLSNTGGSQAHDNHQPSLVLPFCIALTGQYPSRS